MVAGAILAELLLDDRIRIDDSNKKLVDVVKTSSFGDPIIDQGLEKLRDAKRRAALKTWVTRLAGIRRLRRQLAEQLVEKRILRLDEKKVLFLFTQQVYPERNGEPEREINERLEKAIFENQDVVDPRTTILISLASGIGLLDQVFGRKRIKERKKRIAEIVEGERLGAATKEVIVACQSAASAAIIASTVVATTSSN